MQPRALLEVLIRALGLYLLANGTLGLATVGLAPELVWELVVAPLISVGAGLLLFFRGDAVAALPFRDEDEDPRS